MKKDNQYNFFFKNIIVFYKESTSDNKEDNIYPLEEYFIKYHRDINIYKFDIESISYKQNNNSIILSDDKNRLEIKNQSNIDTIVIFRRLIYDNNENDEIINCVNILEDWGFLTINDPTNSIIASNKYETALLLEKYNIPQPRFTLLEKSDIENGIVSLSKKIKKIYPEYDHNDKKFENLELVVKTLDGSLGIGVFMTIAKRLLAILQLMFVIKPELKLFMQRKEKLDGGDIRVNVITTRTNQYIIGVKKRNTIKNDFRSNLSLGGEAEDIELTKEQEELALKVAKVSGLVWCGVDIGVLTKGSNPELGNNMIIEYNAYPGTKSIYDVKNNDFFSVVFSYINNVNDLPLKEIEAGYIEKMVISNKSKDSITIRSELNTNNDIETSILYYDNIQQIGNKIQIQIGSYNISLNKVHDMQLDIDNIIETYPIVVASNIKLGTRKLSDVHFALSKRKDKNIDCELSKEILITLGYAINPSKTNILINS